MMATMTKVLDDVCRHQNRPVNVDDIDYFYSQSANERVPCDALPDINLQPWAEAPPAPRAPAYVEPRSAGAALHPIPAKSAGVRTAVENFLNQVAPQRRDPVFRKHGHRA